MSSAHIDVERLRDVAFRDDQLFTMEEFRHLKTCTDCFAVWSEFIQEADSREKQKTRTAGAD
jgi:hypothetical protein